MRNIVPRTDIGKIPQATYSPDAQVVRTSESGLSWKPLGAASAQMKVGESTPIMFYNSANAVAYVNFGSQATAVSPFSAATSIPLLPNSITVLNSGPNDWVIASAATVFAYAADYAP